MKDFLVKTKLSNGSLSTSDLLAYAERNGFTHLGIAELETLPEILPSKKIAVCYGVEFLSCEEGHSLILFDINNLEKVKEIIDNLNQSQQESLLNFSEKIFNGSKIFENIVKKTPCLNLNVVVSALINLGFCSDLKSALKILNPYIKTNKPTLMELFNLLSSFGKVYLRIETDDIPNLNVQGVIYTGEKNDAKIEKIKKICEERKLKLLFGSKFNNHMTGEVIGADD